MLKNGLGIGLLVGVMIGVILFQIVYGVESWKYSPCGGYSDGGRGIIEEFGDRRFVLFRMSEQEFNPTSGSSNSTAVLFDRKYDSTVDQRVFRYRDKKPYVYTVGTGGFTIVNYETGQVKRVWDKSYLSAKERKIFKDKDEFEIVEADFEP